MAKRTHISEHIQGNVFTDTELKNVLTGSADSRYALIRRAIANGTVIHIRRGLYVFSKKAGRGNPNLFEIALKAYAPSYISLETALSFHGLIPERVSAITCVSATRSKELVTSLGVFAYTRVPSFSFVGVDRVIIDKAACLIASPEKALADYAYVHKKRWTSWASLIDDLRIEEDDLKRFSRETFAELRAVYRSARVRALIDCLTKGLKP